MDIHFKRTNPWKKVLIVRKECANLKSCSEVMQPCLLQSSALLQPSGPPVPRSPPHGLKKLEIPPVVDLTLNLRTNTKYPLAHTAQKLT